METKINIAAILKDKPQGTKLYDLLYNIDVELDTISTTDTETVVWCTNKTDNNTTCHRGYSEFGTVRKCPNGLQILLPSRGMRDWHKFTWKKGDVLVSKHGTTEVIFDGFEDDTYTSFKGKHALKTVEGESEYMGDSVDDYGEFYTENYYLESEDAAQTYINIIEERLGGKLNRETLEIEPAQPEFKDGDIVYAESDGFHYPSIHILNINGDTKRYYARLVINGSYDEAIDYDISAFDDDDPNRLRLATEEEKQQLFSALAKEGKAWDSDKKQIVDLKPKVELKPFDKVLVRDSKSDKWRANLLGYIDKDEYYHCVYANWVYCIPYEGNEHLLGTTKDVED